jgi:hypothetical protein
MLVILKHEKPIKDLPDLVADRLSKMEGVDGSGVAVSMFDAQAGKDFIVRAEALEDARYRGDAVEPLHTGGYVMQSNGTGQPIRARSDSHPSEGYKHVKVVNYGTPPVSAHPTDEEKKQLAKVLEALENRPACRATALTAEELDALAREWTKGIGENLI